MQIPLEMHGATVFGNMPIPRRSWNRVFGEYGRESYFKNNSLTFGLSEKWLKVMRMEGNSQAEAALDQVVVILHSDYFATEARSVCCCFSLIHVLVASGFPVVTFLRPFLIHAPKAALMKEIVLFLYFYFLFLSLSYCI